MQDNKSFLVIGAGIAGLSAAVHLYNNGYQNVVLLEAQDRIGGRILTTQFGKQDDSRVELGANWIHGSALNNSMITLANQLNLLGGNVPLNRMNGFCYTSEGKAIPDFIVARLWNLFQIWENEESSVPFKSVNSRINMRDYLSQKLKSCMKSFPKNQHHFVKCAFNCMLNYERFHQGGPLEKIPVPDIAGIDCDVPGGNIQVLSGLTSIITGLASRLPEECIKLNQEVVKIARTASNSTVIVHCKNGAVYEANHVIVTLPLGVLKYSHQTMFQPPLSHSKVEAIKSLSFGTVNKIFLVWSVPFWTAGRGGIKLAWSDEEAAVLNYSTQWYKKIFAFDEVLNNSNVLVAWISGEEAKFVENLSDKEIIQTCIMVIRKFLHDQSIPEPVAVLQSKWYLAAPLYYELPHVRKAAVLFAGEATCSHGHSTMHGARRSGIREAQRLIDSYKTGDKLSSNI